jgi:hypothetical protein
MCNEPQRCDPGCHDATAPLVKDWHTERTGKNASDNDAATVIYTNYKLSVPLVHSSIHARSQVLLVILVLVGPLRHASGHA